MCEKLFSTFQPSPFLLLFYSYIYLIIDYPPWSLYQVSGKIYIVLFSMWNWLKTVSFHFNHKSKNKHQINNIIHTFSAIFHDKFMNIRNNNVRNIKGWMRIKFENTINYLTLWNATKWILASGDLPVRNQSLHIPHMIYILGWSIESFFGVDSESRILSEIYYATSYNYCRYSRYRVRDYWSTVKGQELLTALVAWAWRKICVPLGMFPVFMFSPGGDIGSSRNKISCHTY